MKKIFLVISMLLLLILAGCTQQKNPSKDVNPAPQQQSSKPSIGGIHLGDPKDDVIKAFGKDYKETYEEEAAYLGEPFYRWVYDRGITVIVGKNTNSVLEIESSDNTLETNLGAKIGETLESVGKKYGSYKIARSNQDNSELAGWYEIEDEQLMIFDFNKNDNAMVNFNVKPDSKVESMKLTYQRFID